MQSARLACGPRRRSLSKLGGDEQLPGKRRHGTERTTTIRRGPIGLLLASSLLGSKIAAADGLAAGPGRQGHPHGNIDVIAEEVDRAVAEQERRADPVRAGG